MLTASEFILPLRNVHLTFAAGSEAANYLIFSGVSQANDALLLMRHAGPVTLAPEKQPGETKPCLQSLSLERTVRSSA